MHELCLHKIGPNKSDKAIGPELLINKICHLIYDRSLLFEFKDEFPQSNNQKKTIESVLSCVHKIINRLTKLIP